MSLFKETRSGLAVVLTCVLVGTATWGTAALACGDYDSELEAETLVEWIAKRATAPSAELEHCEHWKHSIASLRKHGQSGLDQLLDYRASRLKAEGVQFSELENLELAIDKVAGQKFAIQSGLFWQTSLDEAMRLSKSENRPVLSLRMLGRLDEDLSCANSRFFRATLYPDPEIAKRLSEKFILHWQSVRDVPVVTINFGDGRQIKQPLTGNSVHLILDSTGHPFDAMPGLVSPLAFTQWLDEVTEFWSDHSRDPATFQTSVAEHHRKRANQRRSESSMAISEKQTPAQLNPLDPRWTLLANSQLVHLAANSHALLKTQRPPAEAPMAISVTKSIAEIPILQAVRPIENAIAKDTAFNLYALQTKIDDWFANSTAPADYHDFTNRIYADIFLMPLDDPWLGLSPNTNHLALDNGGRSNPQPKIVVVGELPTISSPAKQGTQQLDISSVLPSLEQAFGKTR